MAVDIRFIIDGLDRGQPLNPEDFSVTINEEDSIGARVVSFNNDLTFGGDVYSYLFDKLKTSGYCELVKVRVDYLCGQVWQKLVDGYFIVTESIFEYDKCQVKCKLYDETFSTKINNNKSIPFSMNLQTTKNGEAVAPPAKRKVRMFNPASPLVYELMGDGVTVYDALKHLVTCMSDGLVDFDSNFFATNFGDTDMDVLTNGRNIRLPASTEIVISFQDLYNALRSKFNLGMGFEKQANGRPLLRIEPQSYFFQLTPAANLYDQSGIQMNFDTARLYASVQFGNQPVLEQNESSSSASPPQSLSFTQTPFRGFRNESFGFTGECNTSNVLNLETANVIFDTNTIEDIYRFDNTSYDTSNIVLQCLFFGGSTPVFEAKQTDPYGIGQAVFNGRYTNLNVSNNWISGYPNSLFSYLELPFNPFITQADYSALTTPNLGWKIINTQYTSYQEFNGFFYDQWNVPIVPNTRFDGEQYVVQEPGIYNVAMRFEVFINDNNYTGQGSFKAFVIQFDGNDNEITRVESSVVTPAVFAVGVMTINTQLVCNVGDIIRTDVSGIVLDAGYGSQVDVDVWTTSETMRLEIIGQPFNDENLEPVNIDDVRAYLYKFNRPLTMAEISSITSNTSNPITFGRRNDPLSVIPGYIKSLNIASVLRKNAEITLKSNILLQ
jgi:hypothetical protein